MCRGRCAGILQRAPSSRSSTARTEGRVASAARVTAVMERSIGRVGDRAQRDARVPGSGHQVGQERDRQAARDEREADRGVVGAVADVGLEAAVEAARALGHLLPPHRGVAGRPDGVAQLARAGPRRGARPGGRSGSTSWTGSRSSSWRSRPGGSRHGWCCQWSPIAMSTSPVASAGSACSGSASKNSQRRLGAVSRERLHRGQHDPQRDRLEGRDPHAAADGVRGRGEVGLRAGGALEQRLGVLDQHARRIGEPHAAAGALEQRARRSLVPAERAAGRRRSA